MTEENIPQAGTDTSTATDPAQVAEPQGDQTTPEPQGQEQEKAPEGDAKPVVPETYEFKAPEGVALDEGAIAVFTPIFKEAGLTQDAAQKMVDTFATFQAERAAKQATDWLEASKADKEIGGTKFAESSALAQVAFAKFATPELKEFVEASGLGNHPELLRMFVRIGKASGEAPHVQVREQAPPVSRLYPNSNMK